MKSTFRESGCWGWATCSFLSLAQQALDRGREMTVRCISVTGQQSQLGKMGTASATVVPTEELEHQASCLLFNPIQEFRVRQQWTELWNNRPAMPRRNNTWNLTCIGSSGSRFAYLLSLCPICPMSFSWTSSMLHFWVLFVFLLILLIPA